MMSHGIVLALYIYVHSSNTDQRRCRKDLVGKQFFLSVILMASMLQFTNFTSVEDVSEKGTYLSAGFNGMQDVTFSQKKLSNYLSVNIAQFKSFKQDFGSQQLQDSLEANSQMTLSYALKNSLFLKTNLGFSYSKQDISTVSSIESKDSRHEKMIYGSIGIDRYFLRDSMFNATAGVVRCKDYSSGETNLYPTASLTFSQKIKNANISLSLASEAIGGGSFTGVYGNQMLHHGKIGFNVPLSKRLGVQGDMAFGQTRDAFVGNQKANIFATSVKMNYAIHKNVEFGFGLYNRHLTNDEDFQNPVKEGMMYMASMKVSYF